MEQHKDLGNNYDLACYRIEQSKVNMKDAELLIANNSFLSANNRLYYALFDAVSAVLLFNNMKFNKHKDALGQFNKNFVHAGIFPKEYGAKLHEAEYIRNSSDYGGRNIVKEDITYEIYNFAKLFLNDIYDYCYQNFKDNMTECTLKLVHQEG